MVKALPLYAECDLLDVPVYLASTGVVEKTWCQTSEMSLFWVCSEAHLWILTLVFPSWSWNLPFAAVLCENFLCVNVFFLTLMFLKLPYTPSIPQTFISYVSFKNINYFFYLCKGLFSPVSCPFFVSVKIPLLPIWIDLNNERWFFSDTLVTCFLWILNTWSCPTYALHLRAWFY